MKTQNKLEKIKEITDKISILCKVLNQLNNNEGVNCTYLYKTRNDKTTETIESFSSERGKPFSEITSNYIANMKVAIRAQINDLTLALQMENAAL